MTPMQRYEIATGPDGWLTVDGWDRLAEVLEEEARLEMWAGRRGISDKLDDRANDCRARAAALRAK